MIVLPLLLIKCPSFCFCVWLPVPCDLFCAELLRFAPVWTRSNWSQTQWFEVNIMTPAPRKKSRSRHSKMKKRLKIKVKKDEGEMLKSVIVEASNQWGHHLAPPLYWAQPIGGIHMTELVTHQVKHINSNELWRYFFIKFFKHNAPRGVTLELTNRHWIKPAVHSWNVLVFFFSWIESQWYLLTQLCK